LGGGPWLVGSDPLSTERNFILSIDSYRLDDDGVSYGPYFDDRFKSFSILLKRMQITHRAG